MHTENNIANGKLRQEITASIPNPCKQQLHNSQNTLNGNQYM